MKKEDIKEFQKQQDYFCSNLDDIINKYGEETFVGIFKNSVVDYDKDFHSINRRMRRDYQGKIFYLNKPSSYTKGKE